VSPEALDTAVRAETPEGILLELRPAGLPARSAAFLVDMVTRGAIWIACITVLEKAQGVGLAAAFILLLGLEWLYAVPFELSRWGATPGKLIFGLKVVMDSGLPITPAASLTRNLLRAADFLPLLYGAGLACMLLRPDFKRLGDLAAGTLVVHRPPKIRMPPRSDLAPLAPAIPVRPEDQAVVLALAARAGQLAPDRLDELAGLAGRISGDTGRTGPEVTQRVLAVARWFLGHR
jgi:uncharacterized RDD family membrane protein YckC